MMKCSTRHVAVPSSVNSYTPYDLVITPSTINSRRVVAKS